MARLAVVGSEACDECAFARPAVRTLIIGESGESLLLPSTRPRVVGDNGAAGIGSVTRRMANGYTGAWHVCGGLGGRWRVRFGASGQSGALVRSEGC